MKCLGINVSQAVKNFYNENWKSLKKKNKELLFSWIGRINIAKMSVLSKAIYRINVTTIKTPVTLFTETEKSILKFTWKHKILQIHKVIRSKKQCGMYPNIWPQITLFSGILKIISIENTFGDICTGLKRSN
jgi:hypothetical protein